MNRYLFPGLFSLLILSLGTLAWSAPITSDTALPVAKGEFIFRQQIIMNTSHDDPSPANRKQVIKSTVSVLGFGATRSFAVFGILPYRQSQLDLTENGTHKVRRAQGMGDITLFGRYTVWTKNGPGRTFRVAPLAGLKIPTGQDDKRDSLGRLPAGVQLGSGSWDPFAGVVLTYQTLDYQIDGQLTYKAKTEANSFEFGDEAALKSSLQVRLWPRQLSRDTPGFLYGLAEATFVHHAKNKNNGVTDLNSGGDGLFFAPGLQYVTKRWILETSVQVPLVQSLNGTALQNNTVARAGFRLNF